MSQLLLMACAIHAQPKTYAAKRATAPPKIDGLLDDRAWRQAAWTDHFVDIANQIRPRFRTRAKLAWDQTNLYIAAELEEPDVWGTLTQHDSVIFHDNDFEVFLDPGGRGLDYFEFEINALNTGWDLKLDKPYKDGGHPDNSWEIPGLKTAVHIHGTLNHPGDRDQGWTVEIAMPWKAFGRAAPVAGDQWRVNFSRVEWPARNPPQGTKEDNWVWSPQGVVNMHVPEHWGRVIFK